ncbi:hypothetical protein ACIU1J_17165 [Azospirillum doebereinerae]|uniref:hypothetical protein n=1 Tax=Azospirillum doebereinerae TaxID=92933 RepID=UPI001EE5B447|nr:hypothetical protein [Azospirillum doebereinerae]MCG5241686.1 hypothetical protein [Azospirillum doebereinerae]
MRRARLLHGIAVLLLSASGAAAQDRGGIGFGPEGVSPANLAQAFAQPARQPVFVNAARRGAPPGMRVTNPAQSRKEVHQQLIAKTRGDAGFLAGFHQGQPLAASRQPPVEFQPSITFIDAPFIVNNINSALNIAIGEGNSTDQGVASYSGGESYGSGESGGVAVEPSAPAQPVPATPSPVAAGADPAGSRKGKPHAKGPKFPDVPRMPASMPEVPAGPVAPTAPTVSAPAGQPDALATTLGPLPYLPFAMKNGGVQFNNTNSAINIASGTGNFAGQRVKSIQR